VRLATLAEYVWYGDAMAARALRTLLTPAAWMLGVIVGRRNARYDARTTSSTALPVISVGNLTVGGTGKTPLAAWCVQQLRARGAHPAIVMRGVGDDEWRVHGALNPGVPVIVSPDRTAGLVVARTRGADCAVLDDAFQHRRAGRVADVVLLSADRWTGTTHLLPAGPFREPLASLRRAHVVVITVKAASSAQTDALLAAITRAAPTIPVAIARLVPDQIQLAVTLGAARGGPRNTFAHPASWLAGKEIGVVTAIGDPAAFEAQLVQMGATLRSVARFPDHHTFTPAEASRIAHAAGSSGVLCTLKDAVKLAPCWPREAPPLWYLSQSVVVDRGAEVLDRVLVRLLAARTPTTSTAGSVRPQ
jgi:tetraacyldisaccharide 4'-kinase